MRASKSPRGELGGMPDRAREPEEGEPLGILGVIAIAQLLALTLWFSATAVAPTLRADWHLSVSEVGALTMAVQLGFVVGALALAVFNVPDLIRSRYLFASCAILGAAANACISLLDGSQFQITLLLRFATGAALAGVYPSGLKVMAGWFRRGRGMAMGVLVGALTVGSATPHLIKGLGVDWQIVLRASSGLSVLAALLMLQVGDGPHETKGASFSPSLIAKVFSNRAYRLTTAGYLGHMWELYAMWAWLATWLAASASTAGWQSSRVPVVTFAVIASGGVGCWAAGLWADRAGRPRAAGVSMAISGSCALLSPFVFDSHFLVMLFVLVVWGFSIVADSAQFSAMVTEQVDDDVRGTALTLQTALGFLVTLASIRVVAELSGLWGWRWAFPILAIGPVLGVIAMVRLGRARAAAG